MEMKGLSQEVKDALTAQYALYNPVELQYTVNMATLRMRQRLAQGNRKKTHGQTGTVTFSK
jgi:hypothetical protein